MSYSEGIYQEEFIRYDKQNISGDIIIRIITTDKILFLYQSQFKDTIEELDKIKYGEIINVGVKKLENSGYWAYSVIADNINLTPNDIFKENKNFFKYLKYGCISSLFFTLLLFQYPASSFIFFLLSIFMTHTIIHELYIYSISPSVAFIDASDKIKGIKSNQKENIKKIMKLMWKIDLVIKTAYININKKYFLNKRYNNYYNKNKLTSIINTFNIKVENINIKEIEKIPELLLEFPKSYLNITNNTYEFGSKEKKFTCTTHNKKIDLGYLTVKKHPFFVGINDHIEVYCDLNKNEAIGIYNHTTQSAYLFLPYGYFNYKEISILFRFLLPTITFFSVFLLFSSFLFLCFLFFGFLNLLFDCLIIAAIISLLVTFLKLIMFYLKNRKYIHRKKVDKYAIVKKHLLSKLEKKENLLIINSIDLFK